MGELPLPATRWRRESAATDAPLDGLVALAAERWPDRTAIRLQEQQLTFAELETSVAHCGSALERAFGRSQSVVAIATVMHPDFATAYYGTSRSGNVSVSLNPLLGEAALNAVLEAAEPELLLITEPMLELIRSLPWWSRRRTRIVLIGTRRHPVPDGVQTLEQLAAGTASSLACRFEGDLGLTACLHFTSGTTGQPKGVQLTHRNLTVNAAQVAQAQGLDDRSTVVNNLPLYHIMHLNSAVHAGATQILCPMADGAEAVRAAQQEEASHLFSLPVRLARLASDPRLAELAPVTLRGVFSGGSALPEAAATALGDALGVPVVQGYGLAEMSPLVTLDLLERGRPGSCGPVVAGTDCRVVDLDSGEALPSGAPGEIQVRGPQLMRGYLRHTPLAPGGWFATGDVGHLDADGYLFVVDRLDDVFKCDNEMVAPAQLEAVLARHPGVREAVVFDHPDEFSGAVPHALVTFVDPATAPPLEEVAEFANGQVASFQRIRYIDAVPEIPRTLGGKVQRRELRAQFSRTP